MLLAALAGCPDPGEEFDDFLGRLPDASQALDAPPGGIFDVSGTFLGAVTNTLLAGTPEKTIQFLATQTFTAEGTGGTLTVTLEALDLATRMPIGDPQTFDPVTVSATGEFSASSSMTVVFPAAANPLHVNVEGDFVVKGRIISENLHCGTLEGVATSPPIGDLKNYNTTYAAIRVEPGTVGNDLPPPVFACPEGSEDDAGP